VVLSRCGDVNTQILFGRRDFGVVESARSCDVMGISPFRGSDFWDFDM